MPHAIAAPRQQFSNEFLECRSVEPVKIIAQESLGAPRFLPAVKKVKINSQKQQPRAHAEYNTDWINKHALQRADRQQQAAERFAAPACE
jgi:hypothetical protein